MFRVTTWGESHGPSLGAVIDGCPPGIEVSVVKLQPYLDRRRPGQSKYTTQRKEPDKVEILSGVFEGKTTGTPIHLLITNKDHRSKDYTEISETFRPGHSDLTYFIKYGRRDFKGGGRSSARETAARVAAGGVAQIVLKKLVPELKIIGYLKQLGTLKIDPLKLDIKEINKNELFCPDSNSVEPWSKYLNQIRKSGDSIGAVIEVIAKHMPAGLGAPIYAKLDSDIAAALMSINAVKAVEIGVGLEAATLKGSENADELFIKNNKVSFSSNHAGGILGGISSGQDLIARFAVKPTSSILQPKRTITKDAKETKIITKGRHDPCVGIRAVPVGEAMIACVILDHFLLHRGQNDGNQAAI